MDIVMHPIGYVRSDCKVPQDLPPVGQTDDVRAVLEIDAAYEEGLADVKPGDRLMVLFNFHLSKEALLTVPLRGVGPMTGVFSTHAPMRPNFIGVTTVEVLAKEGTSLSVKGADMLDGTPILDLKSAPRGC